MFLKKITRHACVHALKRPAPQDSKVVRDHDRRRKWSLYIMYLYILVDILVESRVSLHSGHLFIFTVVQLVTVT